MLAKQKYIRIIIAIKPKAVDLEHSTLKSEKANYKSARPQHLPATRTTRSDTNRRFFQIYEGNVLIAVYNFYDISDDSEGQSFRFL